MKFRLRKFRWGLPAWLLLLPLFGCECDPGALDVPLDFVVVQDFPGGSDVAGVKVAVMAAAGVLVAGPVVSDQYGVCRFEGLPHGVYRLLVFGGADFEVVTLPDVWDFRGEGAVWRGDSTSEPLQIQVAALATPGGLPRIAGQVVDADTGQPLAGAFLSTTPYPSGFLGQTTVQDDVTGAEGRFTVHDIAFAQDPLTGRLIQVQPLYVACRGYLPRTWVHTPGAGDDDLDIGGVTISLQAAGQEGTGSLGGTLVREGLPVAGVAVALGGAVDPQKGAAGLPGFTAVSDSAGAFNIAGLPSGSYRVWPGYLPGDGVVFPDQVGNHSWLVAEGQATDTGELILWHEVELLEPVRGAVLPATGWPELSWRAVPGATSYDVFLDRGALGATQDTTMSVPEEWNPTPGSHHWSVVARNAAEEMVGGLDQWGVFYLQQAAESP